MTAATEQRMGEDRKETEAEEGDVEGFSLCVYNVSPREKTT